LEGISDDESPSLLGLLREDRNSPIVLLYSGSASMAAVKRVLGTSGAVIFLGCVTSSFVQLLVILSAGAAARLVTSVGNLVGSDTWASLE
jgi:hypothetical protein